MDHYKSWMSLKKQLTEYICPELQGRITYFLTRYHKVHDAYGRAAILLDGNELVMFSWIEMYRQESDDSVLYKENPESTQEERDAALKPKWDQDGTYYEMDFLDAALQFRNMPIQSALQSDDYIIRILAILDRRVGKRTLKRIEDAGEYRQYPDWVQQFYTLRLESSKKAQQ